MIQRLTKRLRHFLRVADAVNRSRACDTLEQELEELENIFALLVLGAFVGIPAPPVQISMALMPEMEPEFELMIDKVSTAHDPLGRLFSTLHID
jgi:hypothetical protein